MRMNAALAKYWDSFENASDSEIGPDVPVDDEEEGKERYDVKNSETRNWLSQLSLSVEPECASILYAKSLLNLEDSTQPCPSSPKVRPHRISICANSPALSQSLSNLRQPPPKPRRCIARMTSATAANDVSVAVVSPPPHETLTSYSSQDLVELCRDEQHAQRLKEYDSAHALPTFPTPTSASPQVTRRSHPLQDVQERGTQWTPPGFRERRRISTIDTSTGAHHTQPPSYDQLRIRVERSGSRVIGCRRPSLHALRHTIAVNQEDLEQAQQHQHQQQQSRGMNGTRSTPTSNGNNPASHRSLPPLPSPKSLDSTTSTESVDSGQCSGDYNGNSLPAYMSAGHRHHGQHQMAASTSSQRVEEVQRRSGKEGDLEKDNSESSLFGTYQKSCLPGYPRMASTMDHVLRTSSSIYSLLAAPQSLQMARDLLAKTAVFIQIIDSSPCSSFLPKYDVDVVRLQLADLQRTLPAQSAHDVHCDRRHDETTPLITNYFTIVLRKMVEQVLSLFAKIISRYLGECVNKDRLLTIALEHLIHVVLFGDELCLETIQSRGLSSLLKFLRQPSTPMETSRLLLRALAVLCGVSKGCLQLLSVGGLEVILQQLHGSSTACSIEAAGVLTQLTNPQHSFVQLNNIEAIVRRLLDVIDLCETAESLLLCTAALANTSLQDSHAVDYFYKHNAVTRLIEAYNRHNCSTIFVQEQLVTILSRMAARHYEDCLVAQGAVPVLLEMLTVTDTIHTDYCRRIRYKAAVCIGTLAATGVGLRALYNNQAYAILCHVLQMENAASNPLGMICANIRSKLEGKYEVESAV